MSASAPEWSAAPFAPVAAAVAATRTGFWQEAIDLWRDQLRSEALARLAAMCAAEAALRSGCHGVADHMLARLGEVPDHIVSLVLEAEAVRTRRTAWFGGGRQPLGLEAAEELLSLRLYREAVGAAVRAGLRREAVLGVAVRALSNLGEHRRVLALASEADDTDARVTDAVAAARTACAERERHPAAQIDAFRVGHPASAELDRALAAWTTA